VHVAIAQVCRSNRTPREWRVWLRREIIEDRLIDELEEVMMAPKKFVSIDRLNTTIVRSTMTTMKIEGRSPSREPIVRTGRNTDVVARLKSHSVPRQFG
jgi:hypothetical protein